jgi:hypothetical protein
MIEAYEKLLTELSTKIFGCNLMKERASCAFIFIIIPLRKFNIMFGKFPMKVLPLFVTSM